MLATLFVLVLITTLSYVYSKVKNKRTVLFFIIIFLSLFLGLRTRYNDTYSYMMNYMHNISGNISAIKSVNFNLLENPGFQIFQILLKTFAGGNPQILILSSSFICAICFVKFYLRHSSNFTLSMYLYMAGNLMLFSMGAMKQSMSMALGLLAVSYLLEKKYLKAILFLLLASTIHPFILMYGILFFLRDRTWSKLTSLIIIGTLISSFVFKGFILQIIERINQVGGNYAEEEFLDAQGMNFLRVLVMAVCPVFSFFFREEINKNAPEIVKLSINASVISSCFTILALFGGANMFGRLAYYFLPFSFIALPWILQHMSIQKTEKVVLKFLCVLFYFIFYCYSNIDFIYYNVFNYKWY